MSSPDRHLYEFEPFVLDARSGILLRDGATVRLSPRAFQTLVVLVQHAAELVDKDQLMSEVWPDTFVEEGNLSRNIHELRKALGDDPSEPRYIETIPKRGYRFVASIKASGSPVPRVWQGVETGSTVIEKHTFVRVIDETEDDTDLPTETTPGLTVVDSRSLAQPALARQNKQRTNRVAAVVVVGVLLSAAAVGMFFWLRHGRIHPPSARHAKSTLVRLTNNNAQDTTPSWSPDGKRIAFASNRDGKSEIYVMDVDGSNITRLTNNFAGDDFPRWSPDNRKILFTRRGKSRIHKAQFGKNWVRFLASAICDG